MKSRPIEILKKIVSGIITILVLLIWAFTVLVASIAKSELLLYGDGTAVSNLILFSTFIPIVFFIIFLIIWQFIKKSYQNKLFKTRYFSLNILLISLFWGSASIAFNIKNGMIKVLNNENNFYQIIELPGRYIVNIFDKIPGFFPFYSDFLSLLKDSVLTFSTITLIYIALIAIKIAITELMTFIGHKIEGYWTQVKQGS